MGGKFLQQQLYWIQSNGDINKTLSIKKYLTEIRPS